jgi:hypothetical protein
MAFDRADNTNNRGLPFLSIGFALLQLKHRCSFDF